MSYIYLVFVHLKQLWMGIWQHIHTVTTTASSPDLGKFAEILDNVNVEMILLRYRGGCRTFQTASHIYVIHNKVFEHLKYLWMGIWQHIHTVTSTDDSPDLEEFTEIIFHVNMELIPLHYR